MVNSLTQKHFIAYDSNKTEFTIDSSREGFVYIIRASGTNRIKIGHSKDPEKRLASLTSPQMPFDLELVYKRWFIDAYALEQHIHKIFRRYRVKGEWFEIPIQLQQAVVVILSVVASTKTSMKMKCGTAKFIIVNQLKVH